MTAWTKVDLAVLDNPPGHLESNDPCWFLRDLLVDRGSPLKPWELSPSNQLIYDLKVSPEKKASVFHWNKKMAAIETFAQELARNVKRPRMFVPIPSSKHVSDPLHDNRLELVLIRAAQINSHVLISRPLVRTRSVEASHSRGGSRSPSDHLPTLAFTALPAPPPDGVIFLLDDVLTSGSTFKACQQVFKQARPDLAVAGVFWARRKIVAPFPAADFSALFPDDPRPSTP
jgi:hypothetical protein